MLTFDRAAKAEPTARDALLLIAGFLLLRLATAWIYPAMIDEAYAITVSRSWSLSYFDHPPVGFTIARLAAWLAGSENVFVIRLPFVLAGSLCGWLIWDVTRIAYGARAAWWALAWYSVAPFFLISAGHFIVPDGPLNLALLATLRLVLPDLLTPERSLRTVRWLAAGLCFAVALASKYQAGLFGISALAFLIASPPHRRLFAAPALWGSLALGALGLVPVVAWNAAHDWVSIGFQAARSGAASPGFEPGNFAVTLVGQMAYLLPGTWIIVVWMATNGVARPQATADRLFGWLAILPAILFLAAALISRNSLPHWAMSGFLFGFPLAGAWAAWVADRHRWALLAAWRASWIVIPVLALVVGLQARYALFTRPFANLPPQFDVDWQLQDWSALATTWPQLGAPKLVFTRDWHIAGKVGHALGPDVIIRPLADPRHFQFLTDTGRSSAIAIHPAAANRTGETLEKFRTNLQNHGYRETGGPSLLSMPSGSHTRFVIIAVPVERTR